MTPIFEVIRNTIINEFFKDFTNRNKACRALGLTDLAPAIFKVSVTDI